MGWYNVVEPCVVGQLHYARPTAQPIEVDDEVAEPLVKAGSLTPYPAATDVFDGVERTASDLSGDFDGPTPEPEQSTTRTRRPRRTES